MVPRIFLVLAVAAMAFAPTLSAAHPAIVIDADSGRVLHAEEATAPWFPASLTKMMTTYVVFSAVREGRVSLDTPLLYSAKARAQPASKIGLPVNTIITVDNALKMMFVKSANDIAVTLAEGVGGSVEAFADEMNRHAQGLGMTQSHFVNPNGLFDPRQVTSARDMAILARALFRDFPQYAGLYKITSLQFGKRVIRGHNRLLGRFKGADGLKTGFICPSGFNIVASARRGKRRLIAVVLGHDTADERNERAVELLEAGFGKWMFWRTGQEVRTLPAIAGATAKVVREPGCFGRPKSGTATALEGETEDDGPQFVRGDRDTALSGLISQHSAVTPKDILAQPAQQTPPVPVFLGPNPNGPAEYIALAEKLAPRSAPDAPAPKKKVTTGKPAKKAKPPAKKADAEAKTEKAVSAPQSTPAPKAP